MELVCIDLFLQFQLLSVSSSFSHMKCKSRPWGEQYLVLQQKVPYVIWVLCGNQYSAPDFVFYPFLIVWTVAKHISGETEENGGFSMSDIKLLLLLQRKWNNLQWECRRTPNHSPPRLLLPSLMGIQMQRNFSKKTDLGSQCFMLQRIMHFLKFFLWEHLFSPWCYFMDCIYFFRFVHSYQCVYFHSHALETEVPFPVSTNPCNPHQR